jgi:predicted RNA-binding Zn-ribbon protein involved in translation (DUF1610 family)
MKQKITKQLTVYRIELSRLKNDGTFKCPNCGTKISPDDCSDKAYSIIDINVNSYGLEEVIVRCNRCQSQIYLSGLSKVEQLIRGTEKRIQI